MTSWNEMLHCSILGCQNALYISVCGRGRVKNTTVGRTAIKTLFHGPLLSFYIWLPGQEMSHILWNWKVYYRVYKSPPVEPILSQFSPVHAFIPCCYTVHFNIIIRLNISIWGHVFSKCFQPKLCAVYSSLLRVTVISSFLYFVTLMSDDG